MDLPDNQEQRHEFFDDICGICNRDVTEDQAKTELLCYHTIHTLCLFQMIHDGDGAVAITCRQCQRAEEEQNQQPNQELVAEGEVVYGPHLPPEEERQRQRRNSRAAIEEEFQNNPVFRADLKRLLECTTDYNKRKTILARNIKEIKLRYRAEVQLLKNSLAQVKQTMRNEIERSQDYNLARRAYIRRGVNDLLIHRKYQFSFSKIRRVVGEKRGFRRLRTYGRFQRSPGMMLYRAFYFRIRF